MINIFCETEEETRRMKNKLMMFGACSLTCNSVLPCYKCPRGKIKVNIITGNIRPGFEHIGGIHDIRNN